MVTTVMQTGRQYGMVTMDETLADKYRQGLISAEVAIAQSLDPQMFRQLIEIER